MPHDVCIRQWLSFRLSNYSIDELMWLIVIWDVQLGVHQHGYHEWDETINDSTLEKILSLI